MSDKHRGHPGGHGGGKHHQSPGISPAEVQQLRTRVEKLEKQVQEHLAEKNQWSAEVRGWVGSEISISLVIKEDLVGKLLWVDRYTMCLETDEGTKVIVHKAAIAYLQQISGGS